MARSLKMTLWEKIIAAYPELTDNDFSPIDGCIKLRDDSDGLGAYIEKWEYSKPIPDGLKLGK
jgi:hypothetical protein